MNHNELVQADLEWENFVKSLSENERKGLMEFSEPITGIKLTHYAARKDYSRFDQAINNLSKRYLYDEEVIPIVYQTYVERDMPELAFAYLTNAKKYFEQSKYTLPANLQSLCDGAADDALLKSLKQSLNNIRALRPKDLVKITPDVVNDKRILSEFILCEIIQATRVLLDKIQGITKIPHEDRYNDLLLAILRLRFPVWGWSIHDQARTGNSPTRKNAGETDVTVQDGNNTNIALIEALILKGKDTKLTHKHLLKCFDYVSYLERYFMVVFYKGKPVNFDTTWASYKSDVSACKFEPSFSFDIGKDFEDLCGKFEDVNHLHIARSMHGKGVEMFHVMINLS